LLGAKVIILDAAPPTRFLATYQELGLGTLDLGLSPQSKVLDLKEQVRCRGWKRGRAVVSIKWRRQSR
jgi:hypothetical protein